MPTGKAKNESPKPSRFHGILGYDVFISYTRRDGRHYAHELASRLMREHDFVVFLDDNELEVGQHLSMLLRQVRRSRMLVLLATPDVTKSDFVPQEVKAARDRGRRIVPIDLEETIAGERLGLELSRILADEKWETENNPLRAGPSDAIVQAIVKAHRGMRRRLQQRVIIGIVGLVLLALAGFAGFVTRERSLAILERKKALETAAIREKQTRRRGLALGVSRARDIMHREPSRAKNLLEDPVAFPVQWRDIAWGLVHANTDWTLWKSPQDWAAASDLAFRENGSLLVVFKSGSLRELGSAGELLLETSLGVQGRVVAIDPDDSGSICFLGEGGTLTVHFFASDRKSVTIEAAAAHQQVDMEYPYGTEVFGAVILDRGRKLASLSRSAVRFWDLATGQEIVSRRFTVPRTGDGPADTIVSALPNPTVPEEIILAVTTDWEDGHYGASLFLLNAQSQGSDALEIDIRRYSRTEGLSVSKSGTLAHVSSSTSDSLTSEMGFLVLKMFSVRPELGRSEDFVKSVADAPKLMPGRSKVQTIRLGELGGQIGVAYQNGELHLLNAEDGSLLVDWSKAMGPAVQLAFDERRGRLATVDKKGSLRVFRTRPPSPAVTGPAGGRKGSPGLHAFFALTDGLSLSVWDGAELDTGSRASLMDRNTGAVKQTVYALGGFSEQIRTGKDTNSEWNMLALHRALLRSPPIFVADGRYFVGPSFSGLEIVPLQKGQKRAARSLEQRLEKACMAAVAASKGELALLRLSAEIFEKLDAEYRSPNFYEGTWLLETGRPEEGGEFSVLWQGEAYPMALTYSPDGVWLAFADGKGAARVWNTQTGKVLQITSSSRQAKFLSFLPDSSGIMVWFEDKAQGAALEFRSLRAEVAKSLPVEIRDATILRSLAQGRAAVGNREGVLTLIDLEHAITHANAGPAGSAVVGLEVSPDGKTLLVNRVFPSGDGYCTLADADYGHDILELTVDSRSVLAAAFLAKGRGVVMVGDDLKFHVWHLPPENSAAPASN